MAHCIVPAAEAILDKSFPVLDKGFVRLVDYLGNDERIALSARVSYGEGTKTRREISGLIDYLLRNEHTSPFEQVNFTFHLKMPIFVARQWMRHRTARINEISGRYSIMKDEFFVPEGGDIAEQSEDNKQGRAEDPVPEELQHSIQKTLRENQEQLYASYQKLIKQGIAREIARINLPLSLYTEFYWQIDLHNLFHFLRLRLHAHAQLEIRRYAQSILSIIQLVCPIASAAFEEHFVESARFSQSELVSLQRMLTGEEPELSGKALKRLQNKIRLGHE